ncbi:hypothetical protein HBA54_17765 [Pelagibius litoralis]|uniref:OmpR/PhoB-type domain-containing protein n=1 Tax=Pelagibius litoralis TaxID=374515 RepID=A0A967EZV7_9PROT|nr:winged helix-turn-helix domain-containing protein [Pelagibius litoralis]NIA70448.1 hypothetical protein [Pelagibius litoralis]
MAEEAAKQSEGGGLDGSETLSGKKWKGHLVAGTKIENTGKPTILIEGVDGRYLDLLVYVLAGQGFAAVRSGGKSQSSGSAPKRAEVIVLDCVSLGSYAPDALRRIREAPASARTPVLLLTEEQAAPLATGSANGAHDYYVWKSAGPQGIVAGLRRALREQTPVSDPNILEYAGIRMDTTAHRVHLGEKEIHLAPTQFEILKLFLTHPERVFTREELVQAIWPAKAHVGKRTVDVHVGRLRRALSGPVKHGLIRTVHGVGYSLTGE